MSPEEKIEEALCKVGLLRGCLSRLMQSINDHRDEMKKDFLEPPAELGNLMAQCQEHFAGLLKSGRTLLAGQNDLRADPSGECANQACFQILPNLTPLPNFFDELSKRDIEDFKMDRSIIEDGKALSQAALTAIADGSAKSLSLENHE